MRALIALLLLGPLLLQADDTADDALANEALGFLNPSEITKEGDIDAEKYVDILVKKQWVKITKTDGAGKAKSENPLAEGEAPSGTKGKQDAPNTSQASAQSAPSPAIAPDTAQPTTAGGAANVEFKPVTEERKPASPPSPAPGNRPTTFVAPRARL